MPYLKKNVNESEENDVNEKMVKSVGMGKTGCGEDYRDSMERLAGLHDKVKEALETKKKAAAMRLLEQCQDVALKLGNVAEQTEGKGCGMIAILDDYCELVYEINEQVWHGERINPEKAHRYLNKSLGIMKENAGMDGKEK